MDHTVEDHFFSDILLHASISDRICQGHDPAAVREMIPVFISQLCLQDRFHRIFNISQQDCLFLSIDGKMVRKHFHSTVVFPFDLRDQIIPVGECSHGIIRFRIDTKPQTACLFLLFLCIEPFCRALIVSVRISRKPMAFQLIPLTIERRHFKGDACHAFLCVSVDLPEGEISSDDLVFNGSVFAPRQVYKCVIFPDRESQGFSL